MRWLTSDGAEPGARVARERQPASGQALGSPFLRAAGLPAGRGPRQLRTASSWRSRRRIWRMRWASRRFTSTACCRRCGPRQSDRLEQVRADHPRCGAAEGLRRVRSRIPGPARCQGRLISDLVPPRALHQSSASIRNAHRPKPWWSTPDPTSCALGLSETPR